MKAIVFALFFVTFFTQVDSCGRDDCPHVHPTFRTKAISSSINLNFDLNLINFGQYLSNIAAKFSNPAEKQLNPNLKTFGAECGVHQNAML